MTLGSSHGMRYAERIQDFRKRKGLTQAAFAKLMGWKTPAMVSHVETGKRGLTIESAKVLATVLGVSPGEILFPSKPERKKKSTPNRE